MRGRGGGDGAAAARRPRRGLAVRVLPDGDVLVGREGGLARFDVDGAVVRSYPLSDRERRLAMMLRDGGRRLLYGENTSTKTELQVEEPASIVSAVGWTAALGSSHSTAVPVNGRAVLALLGIALAALAVLKLR